MKKFKLALSTTDYGTEAQPLLLKGSVTENLKKAAELGYQAIEIHTREEVFWDFDEIRSCMKETGVGISRIVTGKLCTEGNCSLLDDRPYAVSAAMEGLKKYMDLASEFGAGIVLGYMIGKVPAGKDPAPYLEKLGHRLQILNAYSKEKQVPICIEAINHFEANVLTTSREMVSFLEQYELDNCSVHLDCYHMMMEEDSSVEAIRTAGKRLDYFHICDNQRCYPGSGQLDFIPLLHALEEIGYDGYVSVECFPKGDGYGTAKKAIASLKKMME